VEGFGTAWAGENFELIEKVALDRGEQVWFVVNAQDAR
jgi:hypothetical protein